MTPGALRKQLDHSTDLRIALYQYDIAFADDTIEAVHVVDDDLFIMPAGCLQSMEQAVSEVSVGFFDRFHDSIVYAGKQAPQMSEARAVMPSGSLFGKISEPAGSFCEQ